MVSPVGSSQCLLLPSVMISLLLSLSLSFIIVRSYDYPASYSDLSSEQLPHIAIGGLFESRNSSAAIAFQAAVKYVNQRGLIPGKRLVAHINLVSPHDSFQVQNAVCDQLKRGAVAVFGPDSPMTSPHVQSLCDTLEVPHITTRWELSQRRGSCHINLYPHPKTLSKAVTDIVKGWDWKGFTVLYDSYESLMKIEGILKLADDKGYLVTARQLIAEPRSGYRTMLKEVKYSEERNIVLECSVDLIPEVLTQAQQVGLMGADYNYIITSLDFHLMDFQPFAWGGTNITTVRLVTPSNPELREIAQFWADTEVEDDHINSDYEYTEEGFHYEYLKRAERETRRQGKAVGNIEVETGESSRYESFHDDGDNFTLPLPSTEAALTHDAVILLAKALHYLDLLPKRFADCQTQQSLSFGYSIVNYMKLSEIEGLSGLVKFDHEGFRTEVELEVLEVTEEDGLATKGVWNRSLELIVPQPEVWLSEDSEDLRNTTFTVLIALTHPYTMLKEDSKALKGNDRYEGFGPDLISELALMTGFNFTFKEHPGKSSGNPTQLPNGSRIWDGMIGEVLAGRADLAIADITITREREMDADFTHPFMNLGISILHRKPKKAPPSLFSFLDPFSSQVWAYTVSAYCGVSLLLFAIARVSPYEWVNPYPCVEDPETLENQFSLSNAFWFTVGSLMQQGSDIAPISVSTRMVASMWWFFTLIMVSSYTAQLTSFLTIETVVEPFKDLEELANQDTIKYGAKSGGATVNFFRDSKQPLHQKIYRFMERNPDCMMSSNEEGVERVKSEKNYAFLMESTSIEYEVERNCELAGVGGLIDSKGYGIVMKQNSTYRNILSRNIVSLQERGTLTKLKDKWWKEKRGGGRCMGEEQNEAGALSLDNTGGVFVVLLGGCVFSVIVSVLEILCQVHTNKDKVINATMKGIPMLKVSFREELREELKVMLKWQGRVRPAARTVSISTGAKSFDLALD